MKNIPSGTQQPLYIILHIHKCGGLTLSSHLIKYLKRGEFYGFYKTAHPLFETRAAIKALLSTLGPDEKNRIRVIMGHGAYYGMHAFFTRPCRYVVFLRNPHERTLSNYAYFLQNTRTGQKRRKSILDRKGRVYNFRQWLTIRTDMHDYMTRFLYRQLFYRNIRGEVTDAQRLCVQKRLDTFYLVGLLERPIDQWLLYDSLDIPLRATHEHRTDTQFYPPNVLRRETAPFLVQDTQLYEHFRTRPRPALSLLKQLALAVTSLKEQALFI